MLSSILEGITIGGIPRDIYTITIDGVPVRINDSEEIETIFIMLFNGKYTAGGLIGDPFACINDGLVDLMIVHDEKFMKFFSIVDMLDKAKKLGGIHAYENITFLRGKKIEIKYLGRRSKKKKEYVK